MEAVAAWFQSMAPFLGQYKYPILIFVTIAEGTFTVIAVGIMSAAEILQPWWTYLACVAGTTIGGFFWYGVGYWGGSWPLERFMHGTPVRKALFNRIRHHSDRAAGIIVFLSKLMYAVTTPTLIIVGSLRYDLKRFAWYNFAGSVIWTTVLFWASYGIGRPIAEYLVSLRFTGVLLIGIIIGGLVIWALRTFSAMMLRRVQAAIPEEE